MGITKWEAYPEWGLALRITIISMYGCMGMLLVLAVLGIILKKEDTVISFLRTITYLLFASTIVSGMIVDLDIYEKDIFYYVLFFVIFSVGIVCFAKKLGEKQKYLIPAMFAIMIICFLLHGGEYPYTVDYHESYSEDMVLFIKKNAE